ncbi:hypothetical protein [Streptomyces sp. B1I3]|uniref:hypothetical protein n=1 Tax=Streptomyces sp. B1I3 TaxID=3042264 RepID=UPI002786A48F|nr:hypothetical protein [Streptomyces sp. B1I3]MDQ0793016.1 hypothetical protein [Streptomyces sp. B1I3]
MTGQRVAARAAACGAAVVLAVTSGTAAGADDDFESLPAQQIADRSRDALLSAKSLHLSTRGDLGKGRDPMSIDLTLDRDGNCAGGVDLGGDKGSVEMIKRGDAVWVKADADFWKNHLPVGGSAFEAILGGRYLKASVKDARLHTVVAACDLDTVRDLVSKSAGVGTGTLTKGAAKTVGGARAVPVTKNAAGQELTLYVATEGKHYPVRLTVRSDKADASVDFSRFDKPVATATPSPDDTVDINALLGRSPSPS